MSRKINHFGVVTKQVQPDEIYLEGMGVHVTEYSKSPNLIEYLRFEPGSPMHPLIQENAHIAYEVPNLEEALVGAKILLPLTVCSDTLKIAFVEEEGIAIELMEITPA